MVDFEPRVGCVSILNQIHFFMESFLSSSFDLDRAFVKKQLLNGEISNCIPASLLEGFMEYSGQKTFESVDNLKDGIDECLVDSLGDEDQQVADIKQIISLLEFGTNSEMVEPEILSGVFVASNKKVIKSLQDILLKQRTPKRFCDQYTLARVRNAVKNRPRKLWGKLVHEGTNTILFSDNGVGKTQLCMMVADGIARNESSIFGLEVEPSVVPRIVVYYDFEMTEPMLLKRYGFNSDSDVEGLTEEEMRSRLPQFIRVDFISMLNDLRRAGFDEKELSKLERVDQMFLHIECFMRNNVPFNVLFIIDNITSVCFKTEDNGTAQELMNGFVEFKQEYGSRFSSIILAHTPKVPRDKLLVKEHLKGAKSLSDLADEVIGLKQSCQSEDLFYLKQFKGRVDGKDYDEDNVLIFQRLVSESGSLTLRVLDETEREVLHIKTDEAVKKEIEEETAKLIERNVGLINEVFATLNDFPDGTDITDRVNYLFNASEISNEVFEMTEERLSVRQVTAALSVMEIPYVTKKIGSQTKKGYILQKIVSDLA